MKVTFRQGIVSYQTAGSLPLQNFLQFNGDDVDLLAANKPFTVTIGHRTSDYIHSEDNTVASAWTGPFDPGTDYWLYLDFNLLTFARTFGVTTLEPIAQASAPTSGVDVNGFALLTTGRMWYDTTNNIHYRYNGSGWSEVLRIQAAQITSGAFLSPSINGGSNFAGTQVGDTTTVFAGRVLFDETSTPVQRDNGTFFNTEDAFFTNQSRVDALRLESNVSRAQANATLAAFKVVAWFDDGEIRSALYNDIGSTVVGILTESVQSGEVGAVIVQGTVTNPAWNWTATIDVGSSLWTDNTGTLVASDPHVSDPITYPTKQVPIARVLASDTIVFEQGLGGVGPRGARGPSATATPATTTTLGSVALSATPSNPSAPVAVETTDPRMSDARAPLTHTHIASSISFVPSGNIVSSDLQTALVEIDSEKVAKAGDTMTGLLTLSADPTANLHAATKQYVDTEVSGVSFSLDLNDLNDVIVAGSPLVADQILTFNGTNWVNAEPATAVVSNLNDIGDVVTGGSPEGQILKFVGGQWVSAAESVGGGGSTGTAISFEFDTTTSVSDPGAGVMRFDNATPINVTQLIFNTTSQEGLDVSNLLGNLSVGDQIYVKQSDDDTRYAFATVTGEAIDNTTHWQVPVLVGTGFGGSQPTAASTVGIIIMPGASVGTNANGAIIGGAGAAPYGATGENIIIGNNAGSDLSSSLALSNVIIGQDAGRAVTSGDNNVIIGVDACGDSSTSSNARDYVFIGRGAGFNAQGSGYGSVCVGRYAGKAESGTENVWIGPYAGHQTTQTSGSIKNTAVGARAGQGITNGDFNTFVGTGAGNNFTTGIGNVCIGRNAGPTSNLGLNQLFINSAAAATNTPLIHGIFDAGSEIVTINGDFKVNLHAYFDAVVANTTTVAINWTNGNKQSIAPSGSPVGNPTYTFTDPDGLTNLIIKATNLGAAGSITWPAEVLWPGGVEPTWTASGTDIISFYYDGTNYYGMAGLAFA